MCKVKNRSILSSSFISSSRDSMDYGRVFSLALGIYSFSKNRNIVSSSFISSVRNSMDYGSVFSLAVGFSASFFLCLPNLKKWRAKQFTEQKLYIVNRVLELAEERLVMYQQRHDHLLSQITSHYLSSMALEEALADSKDAMNEASKFVMSLRKLQLEIITLY